jgi:hypothetical protein
MVRWRYAPALALLALIPLAAAGDAPMPPGNLDYTIETNANGSTSLHLFWEAPTDTGSSALASYEIYRTVDQLTTPVATVGADVTTYEVEDIQLYTPYAFYVRAVNVDGHESLPSNLAIFLSDGEYYPHCTVVNYWVVGAGVSPHCLLPPPV